MTDHLNEALDLLVQITELKCLEESCAVVSMIEAAIAHIDNEMLRQGRVKKRRKNEQRSLQPSGPLSSWRQIGAW